MLIIRHATFFLQAVLVVPIRRDGLILRIVLLQWQDKSNSKIQNTSSVSNPENISLITHENDPV
jgi:hypothetical protein